MANYDVKFRFAARSTNYATVLLRESVLRPAFGRIWTDRQAHAAFTRVLTMWRSRITALHDAGLNISEAKVRAARNCPPPGSGGDQTRQPCKIRICPYCHVRKLLTFRERIKAAYETNKDLLLLTYSLDVNDPDKHIQQIFLDEKSCCFESLSSIIDTHKAVRQRIRERVFANALGTIAAFDVIPMELEEAEEPMRGYARVVHRCIGLAMLSPEDVPDKGTLFERRRLTQQRLVLTLARMFTYPVDWLSTDPEMMVDFLNAACKQQLLTRTGLLKDPKI